MGKSCKVICEVKQYLPTKSRIVSLPARICSELGIEKGDYVEITIMPVLRPKIEEADR